MFKRRLIPVLFLKEGWMVRSEEFHEHQFIGDPVSHVRRMVDWDVDELIVLDIGDEQSTFEHHRSDFRHKPVGNVLEFIQVVAAECRIPLTFGGRIRTFEDVKVRIQNGADKVAMNTLLYTHPESVSEAALAFGRQAIVASIDYRMVDGRPMVFCGRGKLDTGKTVEDWSRHAENCGAGEILLNSIDRDGTAMGYDLETIDEVARAVGIPVIACGGAGMQGHFLKCYDKTTASAVAAGNIFHFKENAYPNAKRFLKMHLADIRFET